MHQRWLGSPERSSWVMFHPELDRYAMIISFYLSCPILTVSPFLWVKPYEITIFPDQIPLKDHFCELNPNTENKSSFLLVQLLVNHFLVHWIPTKHLPGHGYFKLGWSLVTGGRPCAERDRLHALSRGTRKRGKLDRRCQRNACIIL